MTENVLEFLRFGVSERRIASLPLFVTARFLSSLCLSSVDSPDLMLHLLPSLVPHPQIPRALAYARLDYVEISRFVLEAEAMAAAGKVHKKKFVSQAEKVTLARGDDGETFSKSGIHADNCDVDECYAFEAADETARVKLAILSLRRRAQEFSLKIPLGPAQNEFSPSPHEDIGSMWNNEFCWPELLYLLPVAVSRCPAILTPEQLIKGLLSATCACFMLVTAFSNNPTLLGKGAMVLANMISRQSDTYENHLGSPYIVESIPTGKAVAGGGTHHRERAGAQSDDLVPPLLASHYIPVVTSVLASLCHISPSFALVCREALVKTCTLAEVVLHITVEILHDELQFLSKLIFAKERSSLWILSFIGANQKYSDNQHSVVPFRTIAKETEGQFDTKGTPLTCVKGVTIRVRESLLRNARATLKRQGWCGRLHAHLRLYCVLIRASDLQPTHEEIDFWIRALGGTMDHPIVTNMTQSVGGMEVVCERTLQLGISFVCLVPGVASSSTKALFHACIANLLRATMLVREALGVHVTVHTGAMRDLADAAVSAGVLSDPITAAQGVSALRPSGPISSIKNQESLGLKCLEQLLNASSFARSAVDISETVMHFIRIAGEPIHPVLPSLVQAYTELSVSFPQMRGDLLKFCMPPFSCSSLLKAAAPGFAILRNIYSNANTSKIGSFPGSTEFLLSTTRRQLKVDGYVENEREGDYLATTALIIYYILCREQTARKAGVTGGSIRGSEKSVPTYGDEPRWTDLLAGLPLQELLMYMEANWTAYEHLLPQLLCVASTVVPERCTAHAFVMDLERTKSSFQTHVEGFLNWFDLNWVGYLPSSLVEENQEEMPASRIRIDWQGVILEKNHLQVDVAMVASMRKDPPMEGNQVSCMDDKEQREMVLSNTEEERKQEFRAQLSRIDVDGRHSTDFDIFSLEMVTVAMRKALQYPLLALRILRGMTSSSHRNSITKEDLEAPAGLRIHWQLEASMMKELVPHLLDRACPRCLQDQFCLWWRALPSSTLDYLIPVLLDLIKDPALLTSRDSLNLVLQSTWVKQPGNGLQPATTLSTSGLAEEPLKLLVCNMKVFRSPLLSIILNLLLQLLVANRLVCQRAPSELVRDGIKREEIAAALMAQNSAVCQILLEACLPRKELGDEDLPGPMHEARSLICATICCIVHANPLLLKLLHFQVGPHCCTRWAYHMLPYFTYVTFLGGL